MLCAIVDKQHGQTSFTRACFFVCDLRAHPFPTVSPTTMRLLLRASHVDVLIRWLEFGCSNEARTHPTISVPPCQYSHPSRTLANVTKQQLTQSKKGNTNVFYNGRCVSIESMHGGIEPSIITAKLTSPTISKKTAALKKEYEGRFVFVGIDKVFYT